MLHFVQVDSTRGPLNVFPVHYSVGPCPLFELALSAAADLAAADAAVEFQLLYLKLDDKFPALQTPKWAELSVVATQRRGRGRLLLFRTNVC